MQIKLDQQPNKVFADVTELSYRCEVQVKHYGSSGDFFFKSTSFIWFQVYFICTDHNSCDIRLR